MKHMKTAAILVGAIVVLLSAIPVLALGVLALSLSGGPTVVDTERAVMAVGEGMHADEEAGLLDDGSCEATCGASTSTIGRWQGRVVGI